MLRYNYVIFGSYGLYEYSYSDVIGLPNVEYVFHPHQNLGWMRYVHRIHTSKVVNRYFNIPGKEIWNKYYFQRSFNNSNPICFLFISHWPISDKRYGLTNYLRKTYPNCKIVWFIQDIMQIILKFQSETVDELTSKFDKIFSIDQGDCKKYGFIYHPLVFSSAIEAQDMPWSDVYFLGKAKDRLSEIIQIYELLYSKGLNLDFYIVGVRPEDRKYQGQIHYIDGMDYCENLQHVLHTRCLLEIMQGGQNGYTQRTVEAVCLGKKMLTNNPSILNAPFFNSRFISTFNQVSNVDLDFVSKIPLDEQIDYHYKEKLSPIELLEFIDERL